MTSKPIFICHRKVRCWNTFSSLEVQVSNQVWLQEWMWVLLSRTYPEEGKMRWKEIYGGEGNAQFPYLAFIHFSFLLGSVYTHTPPPPPPTHTYIYTNLWRKKSLFLLYEERRMLQRYYDAIRTIWRTLVTLWGQEFYWSVCLHEMH